MLRPKGPKAPRLLRARLGPIYPFTSPWTVCLLSASNDNDMCSYEDVSHPRSSSLLNSRVSHGVFRPLPELCPSSGVRSCARTVDWFPEPLLACSSHSLSSPASHGMPQGQGKHSWWSSHSPLTGGHGEEFAIAPAPRSGRQMTSVSDQWECQVIPAWWDYSSEGHEESVPPEEEKNTWHRRAFCSR